MTVADRCPNVPAGSGCVSLSASSGLTSMPPAGKLGRVIKLTEGVADASTS
jgi:hypothetical protein